MFIVIIVTRTMNNSKIIKTIRPLFRANHPVFCSVIFLLIDLQREKERQASALFVVETRPRDYIVIGDME